MRKRAAAAAAGAASAAAGIRNTVKSSQFYLDSFVSRHSFVLSRTRKKKSRRVRTAENFNYTEHKQFRKGINKEDAKIEKNGNRELVCIYFYRRLCYSDD